MHGAAHRGESPARRLRTLALLLFASAAAPVAAATATAPTPPPPDDDARAWLERMVNASRDLNYDATFVFRNGGRLQVMRIIHRGAAQGERERLVSLSGAAREVVRDGSTVKCILPDDAAVVVTKRRPGRFDATRVFDPEFGPHVDLSRHYVLSVEGTERVAGRDSTVVSVSPRDQYRYGYRLALDRATGLLLKSELLDGSGTTLEQIVYTTLATPSHIPDSLLAPALSGKGFTWYTSEPTPPGAEKPPGAGWRVAWMPDGFALTDTVEDPIRPSRMPVEHLVYSDGLATVSVFIEKLASGAEPLEGSSTMGAVNAFGTVVHGYQVTAVGEVPRVTAERIATSVSRR